mmetsp:Transcript_47185/g.78297  ORF Transcript_47185/g.78297 Transcript_47185/m.78297 type:complete len:80 (-) Transcript_47185:8-247(-)
MLRIVQRIAVKICPHEKGANNGKTQTPNYNQSVIRKHHETQQSDEYDWHANQRTFVTSLPQNTQSSPTIVTAFVGGPWW